MDKAHIIWSFQWILYCLLHSFLANNYIKGWFHRNMGIGSNFYRLIYNLVALIYLLVLLLMHVRLNSTLLFNPSGLSRFLALAFVLPGAVVMMLCIAKYFKQLSGAYRVKNYTHLHTGGLHRYVRHPLYFGTFLFLIGLALYWPMLKNISVVAIIILYTLLGTLLEEKKLLCQFGQTYKDYQQNVPMIIPHLRIRIKKTFSGK